METVGQIHWILTNCLHQTFNMDLTQSYTVLEIRVATQLPAHIISAIAGYMGQLYSYSQEGDMPWEIRTVIISWR